MLWLARIAFFFLMTLALPVQAGSIMLILSDKGGVYGEFSKSLEESLSGTNWNISATLLPDNPAIAGPTPDLIVTVGVEALKKAWSKGDPTPIVATLLPKLNYERIVTQARRGSPKITAIFLDQPPARQALFLRQLLPGQKQAGMLLSSETKHLYSQYRHAFANSNLTLESEESERSETLLPALNAVLGRSAFLLAIPDSTIYQRTNIKAILITAFRHQKPVIGYSPAFVNAGALAALHTTPAQIARQTADMIVSNGTNLPPPVGPTQFAIAINPTVAQALGLNIPDESAIRRAMLADREFR
jgi:ABC-type uncharacterized transport system substrate-binding protein